ncbi:luciferase-like monooxygenase [Baia soyae]|uniref:Luciferase-like monooxygenase n=1 Tax=Baia soyae TaxID=1544746 RepID=A0A4R2SEP3_9BACL|nr:luciferase-like monooxygenase [Baia soyae]
MVNELHAYFHPEEIGVNKVRANPGEGLDVPIWLLGSGGFTAQLAGRLGLPFAFASHFAPDYLLPALELYRSAFIPSKTLDKPYVMVGLSATVADSSEEARFSFSSLTTCLYSIFN